jgi:hypothetical protein
MASVLVLEPMVLLVSLRSRPCWRQVGMCGGLLGQQMRLRLFRCLR